MTDRRQMMRSANVRYNSHQLHKQKGLTFIEYSREIHNSEEIMILKSYKLPYILVVKIIMNYINKFPNIPNRGDKTVPKRKQIFSRLALQKQQGIMSAFAATQLGLPGRTIPRLPRLPNVYKEESSLRIALNMSNLAYLEAAKWLLKR